MFFGLTHYAATKGRHYHAMIAIERLCQMPDVGSVDVSYKPPAVFVEFTDGTTRVFKARKSFTYAACKALAALAPDDS